MQYLTSSNLRIGILTVALALSLWSLSRVGAQVAGADRIDRRLEQLDRQQQGARLDSERRFGVLQADIKVLQTEIGGVKDEIGNIKHLGIGIISAVALLIVQSLWGLVVASRHKKDGH